MNTDLLLCFSCMQPLSERNQTCPHCGYDNRNRTNGPGMLSEQLLQGQYLVGQALGRGGFGITYIGYDINLAQRVAIKEYYPAAMVTRSIGASDLTAIAGSEENYRRGLQRALQESRMAAQLRDIPGVVQTYNVFTANNTVYIIMEYVEGQTLSDYVESLPQKLTLKQACLLLRPVANALAALHNQNVIHRDVKPDNIMVRAKDRRCVLLDFGAARAVDGSTLSRSAAVVSAGYAPVEQYSLTSMDARIDQYALAATLYFTLTGEPPVDAMQRIAKPESMTDIRAKNQTVNATAEKALLKGLAMNVEDRYPNLSAFWAAFSGESLANSEPFSKPYPEPQKPKLAGLIAAVLAVVVAVCALLYFVLPSTEDPKEEGDVTVSAQTGNETGSETASETGSETASTAEPMLATTAASNTPTVAPAPALTPAPDLTVTAQRTAGDWQLGILQNGAAMIVKYTGGEESLQIPTSIDGCAITAIGPSAFEKCNTLTDVVIPEGITVVSSKAFNLCDNLRSVTIPDSVVSVGGAVFASCPALTEVRLSDSHPALSLRDGVLINHQAQQLLWYPSQLTADHYTIPDGIVSIGDHAFTRCDYLTGVSFPASVTDVGKGVFVNSSLLANFTVDAANPVLAVENGALYDRQEKALICCPPSLPARAYEIAEGTRTIRDFAFYGCQRLTAITIPDSVTNIMGSVFAMCSSLTEIDLPDSVATLGASAFSSCSKLARVKLSAGMNAISNNTFFQCYALKQVEIPQGITAIGASAFHSCTSLTGVTLPASLTTIGNAAFAKCSSLLRMEIPSGVTSIGNSCFSSCTALQSVVLPETGITMGDNVFYNCPSLVMQ